MFLRRLPIWLQLLLIASITILITVSVFFATYTQITGIIMEKNTRYTEQLLSQLKQNVSTNYKEIGNLLFSLAYNSTVQEFMTETDPLERYELDKKVFSLLGMVKSAKNDLYDIIISGNDYQSSSLSGGSQYAYSMEMSIPVDGSMHCTGFIQTPYWKEDVYRFLFGFNVFAIDNTDIYGKKIGFVAAIVDADEIVNQIYKMPDLSGMKIYLSDKNGRVISIGSDADTDNEKTGTLDRIAQIRSDSGKPVVKVIDGKKSVVQIFDLPEIGGRIISVVPVKDLFAELSTVQRRNLFILFAAILLLSLSFMVIIRNILFPLKKLVDFMNQIKSGSLKNLKKRIELQGYAEMTLLAQEFNGMLDEIDALTHRLVDTSTRLLQTELDRKESMLAFMQSQINPHFLYNTFECIKGIATVKHVPEIRDMTQSLSRIFCYSIKGSDNVTLKEEIDIVRSYVQIHKIRFAERFSVEYDIADNVCDCIVPKMIMQPIIENAIFHGIEPLTGKGKLLVAGKEDVKGDLMVTIRDNGVGMDEDRLVKLRSELEYAGENSIRSNARIGLVNVNNRLKFRYGDRYGLTISSGPENGTEVILKMPLRRMKDVQGFIG